MRRWAFLGSVAVGYLFLATVELLAALDSSRGWWRLGYLAAGVWFGYLAVRWWRQRNTITSTGKRKRVPTRRDDMPILAWKLASVWQHRNGGLAFTPWMQGTPYPVEADATCGRGHHHRAPDLHCACGFYALREPPRTWMTPRNVMLQVELSGKIIVGTKGYRAQHSQVLAVYLGQCECGLPASHVAMIDFQEVWTRGKVPAFTEPGQIAVCAAHAVAMRDPGARAELGIEWVKSRDELTEAYGIPVTAGFPKGE